MDTVNKFLQGTVFLFDIDPAKNQAKRGKVVEFIMVMDSELAPIVGQQITLTENSGYDIKQRINLLKTRALITSPRQECDLIVKGVIDGKNRGYLLNSKGTYQSDIKSEVLTDTQLRDLAKTANQSLTFTCVPPGSGIWMGIDHDMDGNYDADEIAAGTNVNGI